MTQTKVDIPLMDEFEEDSLLSQIKTPEEEGETEEEKLAREEAEATEAEKAEAKAEEERLAKEQEEEEELTEEELAAKAEADKKAKEEEEEGSFWGDVEAITGNAYEVDYGDVKPDSPEGAALREKVVADTAVTDNLDYLEKNYPKAFEVLTHVSNGGKFEDLFNDKATDFASITLSEDNVEQQKAVLKNYYLGMGLSEAKAVRNVEDDEDSEEGLFKNATAALKSQQELETTQKQTVLDKQVEAKKTQDAQDVEFGKNLSGIINKGQVGNFKIPKGDAEAFYKHVLSQVQRSGEGYSLAIPLTNENFQEQLQQMFFGFKKGDLSKFVVKASKTANARSLKRNIQKDKGSIETSSEEATRRQGGKLPSMGAFEV